MTEILRHLISLGKPRAQLVVGDFIFPCGNPLARLFKKGYWYIAACFFWLFTDNAFHGIYNYPAYIESLGLEIREKKRFSLLNIHCYWPRNEAEQDPEQQGVQPCHSRPWSAARP